jgi:tyrosine ammonia-lyase
MEPSWGIPGGLMEDHGLGLIDFLSVGQGSVLSPELVRAMLLVRVWSLAQGHSGISTDALMALSEVLAAPVAPVVPEYGSVGASGDLVPLAHAVAGLMGRGDLWVNGERLPAEMVLRKANLRPLQLTGRDALALVNGTPLTAAAAGLACTQAIRSTAASIALSALMLEVLGAGAEFASAELLAAYGHGSAEAVASLLRQRMQGSTPLATGPFRSPTASGASRSSWELCGQVSSTYTKR